MVPSSSTSSPVLKGGVFLFTPTTTTITFTPEDLDAEHRKLAETTVKFSSKEVFSKSEEIEAKEEGVISKLIREAGRLGLLTAEIPRQYGGLGLGKVASTVIAENITHQCSFAVAFLCHTGVGMYPVLYFGNENQKKRYLPRLGKGELLGAFALTEEKAGTDAMAIRSNAVLYSDKKYCILSGEKPYCTSGGISNLITVFAKVDHEQFTAFLVERSSPGVSCVCCGAANCLFEPSIAALNFHNVKVPVEDVLGEIGRGHKVAFSVLNMGRLKLAAACCGTMKRLIEHMTSHANARRQFDKPIASFQLIREKIARSVVLTYLAESMVYRLSGDIDERLKHSPSPLVLARRSCGGGEGWPPFLHREGSEKESLRQGGGKYRIDALDDFAIEASITKVFASEALEAVSGCAMQILGGYGFVHDHPIVHYYRNCLVTRIFEGTNEINRLIIAQSFLKRTSLGKIDLKDRLQEILVQLKSGFPAVSPKHPHSKDIDQIERLKILTIYLSGIAFEKYVTTIESHQYILAMIADLLIEIYALESGLVRAIQCQKKLGGKKAGWYEAIISIALAERMPVITARARQTLVNMAGGDKKSLASYLDAFDSIVKYEPVNTAPLYDTIAARSLEREAY